MVIHIKILNCEFCINVKTDVRFLNSYKWAEAIFMSSAHIYII